MKTKLPGLKLNSETLCILESQGARGFAQPFITCPTEVPRFCKPGKLTREDDPEGEGIA
jgi:hypothetical protein